MAALAGRVAVIYAGRPVELGTAEQMFAAAGHPYTRRLIGAIPRLTGGRSLTGIPAGHALSPGERPNGCGFAPRCQLRIQECDAELPELRPVRPDHLVRCVRAELVMGTGPGRAGDVIEMPAAGPYESIKYPHISRTRLPRGRERAVGRTSTCRRLV